MNRPTILLGVLLFFSCGILAIIAIDQSGSNYEALTDEFMINHPMQSIIPYPWETGTSVKILPFDFTVPAIPSDMLSLAASRNQFESASFVITARKDLYRNRNRCTRSL